MARSKQKRQRSRGKAENNTPKKTDEEDRAGGDPRGDEEDRVEEEDDTHNSQQNDDDGEFDASKEVRTRRLLCCARAPWGLSGHRPYRGSHESSFGHAGRRGRHIRGLRWRT